MGWWRTRTPFIPSVVPSGGNISGSCRRIEEEPVFVLSSQMAPSMESASTRSPWVVESVLIPFSRPAEGMGASSWITAPVLRCAL